MIFLAFSAGNRDSCGSASFQVEDCNCTVVSDTLFVTNSKDTGEGSFRCALECAALTNGKEIIAFDLLPGQDSLINLKSVLPAIPSNTWILNGDKEIIIDGSNLLFDGNFGLRIDGDSIIIKGLTLRNFPNNAIDNYGGHREILIQDNKLLNNGRLSASGDGIDFRFAENCIFRNNTISANKKDGIYLHSCTNIYIASNQISYNWKNGVHIFEGQDIDVGDSCTNCGNIITGNLEHGVKAFHESSRLNFFNNYIGIHPNEIQPVPNGLNGIFLSDCDSIQIGKPNSGNTISGNTSAGVKLIDSSYHISFQNNRIGYSNIPEIGMPNGVNGIEVLNSYYVMIGGDSNIQANEIGYHFNNIYIGDSSQNCSILHNEYFCSSNGLKIEAGSNNDVEPIDNFDILGTGSIGGTSSKNLLIQAYLKNPNCGMCQGTTYLGATQSNSSDWVIEFDHYLNEGDEVTLMVTDQDGNSSIFSSCRSFSCESFNVNIIPVGQDYICANGTLDLKTDYDNLVKWSTGETNYIITISQGGEYSVQVWNEFGCPSFDTINIPTFASPPLEVFPADSTIFCEESMILNAVGQGVFEWNTGDSGPIIIVENSDTYCVNLTNQYNCTTTACVDITSGDQVEARIEIIGDSTFCEGDTAILKASGGTEYLWNTGQQDSESLMVNESGLYTVTVINDYGCLDSISQQITVYPAVDGYLLPNGYQIICPGDSMELTAFGGSTYEWNNGSSENSIMVDEWGSYVVTMTNEFGCSEVLSQSVSVKPRINAEIVEESPVILCAPESVMLNVEYDKMDSVQWSTGVSEDSTLVSASGLYSVEVFNLGCVETDSVWVEVLAQPARVDSFEGPSWSNPDSIQHFYVIDYDPELKYVWEVDGGLILSTTNESLEVEWTRDDYGLICVTAIDTNGCHSEAFCRMIDLAPLDIQLVQTGKILLYPNPTNGILNVEIESKDTDQMINLEFYNPSGQLVSTKSVDFSSGINSKKLDISEIPGGVYWVKIHLGKNKFAFEKILLNR